MSPALCIVHYILYCFHFRYTELPVLTGIAIRNDPKDPYHLSRQEVSNEDMEYI